MKLTNKKSLSRIIIVLSLMVFIVILSIITDNREVTGDSKWSEDTLFLYYGSLDNWHLVVKNSTSPDETFLPSKDKITITGNPYGYMRTRDAFSDYKLHIEWRWPEEPGNSGVFLHVQQDSIWPVCLECQLKDRNAGDFVCFPGFDFAEHQDKDNWVNTKFTSSSEYKPGEWNSYDIQVDADSVSISVNGVLQNIATETNYTSGYIAIQSEGAPVEFRNIYLIPLR